ncbi:MAG: 4Fe-4S dicluster domain-containing protein [Alphaproteobacteria bacterium]
MTEADIDRVLTLDVFRQIDATQFPENQSLRDIIRNDARIQRYWRGDIVVKNGDYGNSVFVIIEGTARVILDDVRGGTLGRRATRHQRSFFETLGQTWNNVKPPEVRDSATYQGGAELSLRGTSTTDRVFLREPDSFIAEHNTHPLTEGDTFGEIAALSRSPRIATVFADSALELVELRWQGLRDIRRRDRHFRDLIDRLYRDNSLSRHLAESPLFAHLADDVLDLIAAKTLFETYGEFEWWSSYKKVVSRDSKALLEHEPVVAEQGSYLDGLLMIRSGFARISRHRDHGERTIGYATTNDTFGLEEIVRHWRDGAELRFHQSLRAIGYVDILRVPTALVEEYVLPHAPDHLLPRPPTPSRTPAWEDRGDEHMLEQSLIDFFVDNRTINGTATMLINTDRCIGCDDCVRACASTHDNNPRFIRHGLSHGNIQVANACMHCVDPVCLIGCPTGAIARNFADGRVMIDDRICIGCGTCANSCPYDNIQLVEIRDRNGAFIIDAASKQPILKATKCDLCYGQLGGPACQRACPHDALIRIDMHDQSNLAAWVNRS